MGAVIVNNAFGRVVIFIPDRQQHVNKIFG